MRRLLLLSCLISGAALGGHPREQPRTARLPSRIEPATVVPEELAMVQAPDPGGVDAAGALGMLTALGASLLFARSRRAR